MLYSQHITPKVYVNRLRNTREGFGVIGSTFPTMGPGFDAAHKHRNKHASVPMPKTGDHGSNWNNMIRFSVGRSR